jgi:8-oxo-dGTP pyrophosphatase MutT (NUDIX family)
MNWFPHTTVATIVEQNGRFLMVEEKEQGQTVFNQPAGHLDENETLFDAALRETLEETAWHVELRAYLGTYQYLSPANNVTYVRHCFIANPLSHDASRSLDPDIVGTHWLSADTILAEDFQARSPIVRKVIEDYLKGQHYPLSVIYCHE